MQLLGGGLRRLAVVGLLACLLGLRSQHFAQCCNFRHLTNVVELRRGVDRIWLLILNGTGHHALAVNGVLFIDGLGVFLVDFIQLIPGDFKFVFINDVPVVVPLGVFVKVVSLRMHRAVQKMFWYCRLVAPGRLESSLLPHGVEVLVPILLSGTDQS